MTDKTTELKGKIKEKFKNVSRFSTLSKLPYHYIHNAFKKKNDMLLKRIEDKIKTTDDAPTIDEVDEKLIEKVNKKLHGKDLAEWCQDNGVPHYWLKAFLRGDVRFKTQKRVQRLMNLLEL